MAKLDRLKRRKKNRQKKLRRAERGIERQTKLYNETKKKGHLKEANKWKRRKARHSKAITKLNKLIKKEKNRLERKRKNAWGGCQYIMEKYVLPVAKEWGIPVTSTKRWESFGNPSSDHFMLNRKAYATDFATTNNYNFGVAIGKALGVPYNGASSDYASFTTTIEGITIRVQIICGTHGTGPHTHVGLKRL